MILKKSLILIFPLAIFNNCSFKPAEPENSNSNPNEARSLFTRLSFPDVPELTSK